MIAMHRNNATLNAECIGVSVNNCIQVLFSGCNMRMTQFDRIWPEDFNQIESITILPKINYEWLS